MFKRIFQKIKYRTAFFFLLIGVLPTMAIAAYVVLKIQADLEDNVLALQQRRITAVKNAATHKLRDYESQLAFLSSDTSIQSLDRTKTSLKIIDFLDYSDFFSSIFLYDKDGVVVDVVYKNRFQGDNFLIGINAFDPANNQSEILQQNLRDVIRHKKPAVIRWTEPERLQTYLQFFTPVFAFEDRTRLIGVLSSRVRLLGYEIENLINIFPLEDREYTLITDPLGTIYVHQGDAFVADAVTMQFARRSGGLAHGEIGSGTFLVKKREDLISFANIDELGLVVVLGKPYADVMGFLQYLLLSFFVFMAVVAIVAVTIAIYLAENLTAPILLLIDGINRVGEGVTSFKLSIKRDDELGEASKAFNKMTANLQKQQIMEEIWMKKWKS